VTLVRTWVLEECIAFIILVIRMGELGATLAVSRKQNTPRRYVPPKRWFLKEPHAAISHETAYFIHCRKKPQI
jgi:hypothetical protein